MENRTESQIREEFDEMQKEKFRKFKVKDNSDQMQELAERMKKRRLLTKVRSAAGMIGGKISAFARLGNKSKKERSEIMKKIRRGEKINPE